VRETETGVEACRRTWRTEPKGAKERGKLPIELICNCKSSILVSTTAFGAAVEEEVSQTGEGRSPKNGIEQRRVNMLGANKGSNM
jgi:hypothetical protein